MGDNILLEWGTSYCLDGGHHIAWIGENILLEWGRTYCLDGGQHIAWMGDKSSRINSIRVSHV